MVRKLIPVSVEEATSIICQQPHGGSVVGSIAHGVWGITCPAVSAPCPENTPVKISNAANGCNQNDMAFILGSAGCPAGGVSSSSQPLIIGMHWENHSRAMEREELVVLPESEIVAGTASCILMIIAIIPPTRGRTALR